MSYEGVRITEELSESVQRAVRITPQRHATLGELVRDVAAQRGACRTEDLISEQSTRHKVRVDSQIFHAYCFLDALMLPFAMQGERFEVRYESPMSGLEVAALVGEESVEASPAEAVVSFGAARAEEEPVHATLCPYLNAFPRRVRDLGGKDPTGRHRRPLVRGRVRPRPGLGGRWTRGDGLRLLRSES